ncbi:olfactory receptor 10AG1-like [Sphaerodactylus townsendi]|uniref:olfactory receptor 10AG1-like n=1 Tax=Sphaerodactylus townsendi TaxID=933632 RepID=UPI0020275938|nr:olfactory receptor 10AG1-like [Sphaerodactylus townsendi]
MPFVPLQMDKEQVNHWENHSTVDEFILLGYQEYPALLFIAFLATYITILLGNGLIVLVTTLDPALRTPMYFFLRSLSGLEMCYTSVTLPKMMANLVSGDHSISLPACAMQMFCMLFLGGTECFLLAAMAYDRYLAICLPLRYMIIMSPRVRVGMVVISFAISFPIQLLQIGLIFSLPFCGSNEIDHFFCDIPQVLKLACADLYANEVAVYTENIFFVVVPFVLIVASYVHIARAILQMPSGTGRQKTFSTCSSHLTVVSLFYGSAMLVYLCPQTSDFARFSKFLSLLYTIIIPLCNPLIYTLRNREVKAAFGRLLGKKLSLEGNTRIN